MARAASTSAQHQVVSQTTPSGLYAKTSCVWNACWVQLIHSQKASLTSQVLSLLSDAFFFTGFPLSGIYNMPAEVERLIFTALSYQSYSKFKAQCCFHLEIFFAGAIYKTFTSHGKPRPLQFPQFTARESGWHGEGSTIPPKPQLEDSHCCLWTAKLQVGTREDWEAVEVGISFLCSRSLFCHTEVAWLLAISSVCMGLTAE